MVEDSQHEGWDLVESWDEGQRILAESSSSIGALHTTNSSEVPGEELLDDRDWAYEEPKAGLCDELELLETSSDDGFTPSTYQKLADAVLETLRTAGLYGHKLALQEPEAPEMLTQALGELGVEASLDARSFVLAKVYEAIETAGTESSLSKRARGNHTNPSLARIWDRVEAEAILGRGGATGSLDFEMSLTVPRRGRRCNRKGLGKLVVEPSQRKDDDAQKLLGLQGLLVGYLLEAEAPCTLQVKESSNPIQLLQSVIGKTRLSTAGKYLRIWRLFRNWLLEVHGVVWPREVYQFLEYLQVLKEEPCGPSVPQKWFQACCWMYRKGDFRGDEVLVKRGLVRETIDKLITELPYSPVRQAARLPILVLTSLEVYLCDVSRPLSKGWQREFCC
jgi:hypothetical protein